MSAPATPKRATGSDARRTPQANSELQTTPLGIDSSYIEEEDPTYIANETTDISFDMTEEEVSEVGDMMDELLDSQLMSEEGEGVAATKKAEASKKPENTVWSFLIRHEVPRKAFHSSIGVLTLFLFTCGYTISQIVQPLIALFVILFLNDFIRLNNPEINKQLIKTFGFVIRKSEEHGWNGTLFYLGGIILVFFVAPKDVCVMSVLLLSWADTAALTMGRQFGKYTPQIAPGKSLAGSLASFITGVLLCYLFYGYFCNEYAFVNRPGDIFWSEHTSHLGLHSYALLCGLAASVSEAADLGGIDDNFTIPVVSAIFLWTTVWAFHV